MDYHLIIKYRDYQKWITSFSSTIHLEIDEYLDEMGIDELESNILDLERIEEMSSSIEDSLKQFFQEEYENHDYGKFRSKCIKEVDFNGKKYYLKRTNSHISSIRLLTILRNVVKNNGKIILYGKKYLDSRLIGILKTMNNEGIDRIQKIISRIGSVKHPNFNVLEGLLELERKGFIKIDKDIVTITQKGKM